MTESSELWQAATTPGGQTAVASSQVRPTAAMAPSSRLASLIHLPDWGEVEISFGGDLRGLEIGNF